MLTELNLQKFDSQTVTSDFKRQIHACDNNIVQHFVYLHLMWLIYYQRVSIASYANRWYSQRRNVSPSVRPSHSGIVSK